jgi:hypothetical protein
MPFFVLDRSQAMIFAPFGGIESLIDLVSK